jgi:hypothetical protein
MQRRRSDGVDFFFPDLAELERDLPEMSKLFQRSAFIYPGRDKYIVEALHCVFIEQVKLDKQLEEKEGTDNVTRSNRRYHHCLALLLPQLEHCLRRLYVVLNGLPEERMKAGKIA